MDDDKLKTGKENPPTENADGTSFEELFKQARAMDKFSNYSDFELKDKLINFLFSGDDDFDSDFDDFRETDSKEISTDDKENKISRIFNQFEKSLQHSNQPLPDKPERKTSLDLLKDSVLENKQQFLNNISEELEDITDSRSIHVTLFNLSKEIKAIHNNIFWNFDEYQDKDFVNFAKNLATKCYMVKTSFLVKLWDMISGQKLDKLDEANPFINIPIYPNVKWKPLYGTNFFKARASDDAWVNLIFGLTGPDLSELTVDNSHFFSLKQVVTSLSETFDYIFYQAKLRYFNNTTEQAIQANNKNLVNEGLFYQLISEKFLPIIKVFSVIEHIALSYPLADNHPLQTCHLIYLVAWCYVNWIGFLEKTLNEKKNYVTRQGETGYLSLEGLFERIRKEVEDVLIDIDFEEDLETFQEHFTEKEKILKKIDFYVLYIPELKKRLKLLLNNLLGDAASHYLKQKNLFLRYYVKDNGHLVLQDVFRGKGETVLEKIISFFQGKSQDEQEDADGTAEHKPASASADSYKIDSKASYKPQKDYSSYSRTLGDLTLILSKILTGFNENFAPENHIKYNSKTPPDKYTYLHINPYFSNRSDEVNYAHLDKMQDCFESILTTKKLGEQVNLAIKAKENFVDLYKKIDILDDSLEKSSTLFKDTSASMGILSQDREKYEKYTNLINKFYIVYNEFQKISKQKM